MRSFMETLQRFKLAKFYVVPKHYRRGELFYAEEAILLAETDLYRSLFG